MKSFFYLTLLSFFFSNSLFGQLESISSGLKGDFSIHARFVAPTGSYKAGQYDNFSNSIFDDDLYGYASGGIGIGVQYAHPIGSHGFELFGQLDILRNGLNRKYKKLFNAEDVDYDHKYCSYFNVPLTIGARFEAVIKENLALYAQAGPSLNFLKVSDSRTIDRESDFSYDASYTSSTNIGLFIGCGVTLNEKWILGLNYRGYGIHTFIKTYNFHYDGGGSVSDSYSLSKPVTMIDLSFGLKF